LQCLAEDLAEVLTWKVINFLDFWVDLNVAGMKSKDCACISSLLSSLWESPWRYQWKIWLHEGALRFSSDYYASCM
jgi:hypothetical protein